MSAVLALIPGEGPRHESELVKTPPHPDPLPASGEREKTAPCQMRPPWFDGILPIHEGFAGVQSLKSRNLHYLRLGGGRCLQQLP
jgi:hypothetical protein